MKSLRSSWWRNLWLTWLGLSFEGYLWRCKGTRTLDPGRYEGSVTGVTWMTTHSMKQLVKILGRNIQSRFRRNWIDRIFCSCCLSLKKSLFLARMLNPPNQPSMTSKREKTEGGGFFYHILQTINICSRIRIGCRLGSRIFLSFSCHLQQLCNTNSLWIDSFQNRPSYSYTPADLSDTSGQL